MKQKFFMSFLFLTMLFVAIGVFAASDVTGRLYNSTLLIADGATVTGATRQYYAGKKAIEFRIDAVNNCLRCNTQYYTKLKTTLRDGNGTQKDYYTFSFTDDDIGAHCYRQFEDYTAGNRYYHFATKINDVRYSGFRSDSVKMVSANPS